ncbi:probable G-protein coupled receptor 149 [Anguilla anguilla]|uniref:G-protein coupled receptors family 1 profile domain-containing protein n=1 Tax=Anguilla anguilla TaxID=7936 RepID=A0A9D3M1Z9_ANGAN|nr:probable G-protein coupled receptor 149 [Anguilla anguilla]KAG5837023.1 hypothetical protein ANANG_G00234830 [Anguilla anguilla]
MPTTYSSISLNKTNLFTESYEIMDSSEAKRQINLILFCLSFVITTVTLVGGIFSLLSLSKMRSKTSLSLIVASMSIDDLISVIPLSLFLFVQWERNDVARSGTRCTLSGLLYIFQGVSSNLKASLIVAYTFYITKRFGAFQSARRPLRVMWAIAAVWIVSLTVSILPVCGWGSFSPTTLGCFAESTSSYVLLLFVLYSICFCGLVAFSVPLTYRLLCLGDPQKTFHPNYLEITGGLNADGSAPLCEIQSFSRDSLDKSFGTYSEINSEPSGLNNKAEIYTCSTSAIPNRQDAAQSRRNSPVFFAQKRFSLIVAMVRVVLWMPMMVQIFVSHTVHLRSSSLETLCFFLTSLSAAVTPVFVLSEHFIHLPCGCFINCRREPSTAKKRGFEFNLSFQQGYGFYKIAQAKTPTIEKPPYHNLFNCESSESKDGGQVSSLDHLEFRTMRADSSLPSELLGTITCEARADSLTHNAEEQGVFCGGSPPVSVREDHNLDTSSVFEGPERRLSHEESRNIELTDWEWCRSKSERTPRQRSSGGLAIPLCAFQGTVSLHAPTGKTLSLSTYEVSSDGLKISPNGKKVEVYRSKSVGHEPRTEEPTSSVGGDTNVKIHLEVLEICDNEEAMDSVSIISNISQSSTHARSPSLRYSRRENRFVSCDLGESASYSLLIPTSNPDSDINIHIPDTVEAHRQNSRRQHQEKSGYQEEIQLLNEAYRKQEADPEN